MTAQQALLAATRKDRLGTWGVWFLIGAGIAALGYMAYQAMQTQQATY